MNSNLDTFRNATTLIKGFMGSRILGLVRDILLAIVLGGGIFADAFFAAFRLPNFARRVMQEGAGALSFIPMFHRLRKEGGDKAAFAFGRAALWEFSLAALIAALLGFWAAKALVFVLVPGFNLDVELAAATADLLRVTIFYLPLVAAASVLTGMLLAMDRYVGPSISPAGLNLGLIASALVAISGGYEGYEAARIICFGLLVGGGLQIFLQLPSIYKTSFRLIGPVSFDSAAHRSFVRQNPPAVLGSASYHLVVVLAMFMASFLGEGSITALYFAERLLELPLVIVGISLGISSLRGFVLLVLEEKHREFTERLREILSVSLFMSFPASLGMMAVAWPLVHALFAHGLFSEIAANMTASALFCYAPSLPAVAASRPMLSALNARGKAGVTMGVTFVCLGFMLVCARVLMGFMDLEAIAISASLAAWLNLLLLGLVLRKSGLCYGGVGFFPWRKFGTYLCFSLAMFAAVYTLDLALVNAGLGNALRLLVDIPAGAAVYLGICYAVKSPEMEVLRRLRREKAEAPGAGEA